MRTPRPCQLPSEPATRETLLASGFSPQMIRTQLAAGRLVRVRRGVFLDAGYWPDDPAGRHLVRGRAEQAVHPAAVLSHESAATFWKLPHPGFREWHAASPAVTLPSAGGAKSRAGTATHHTGALPVGQVTRDDHGYAVTTVARTAVDLAAGLAVPESLVLLDAASRRICESMTVRVRRSDYANHHLAAAARDLLTVAAQCRRPAGLARAIALCDPCRESAAESLSAGHLHLAGLPMPLFQQPIRTPIGTLFPDCLWPEQQLIGECDGAVKYADADAYVREKQREQVLRDLGWRIVRWLAREIMTDPALVMARIGRELGL